MTTTIPSLDDLPAKPKVLPPSYLAHVVLQTTTDNLSVMRDFYTTFTGGHVVFDTPYASFLTYDSEHHRIALVTFPQYKPKVPDTAGLSHIAFTFASLADLLTAYQQRKKHGIEPSACVNHGPTTSIYYKDPDGNMLETQVDNFDTVEETTKYMMGEAFQKNPLGSEFVPEDLIEKLKAGISEKELKRKGDGVDMRQEEFVARTR
ncbi:Glyoxalase/Bleomycin resistance protein/Dihydroxybiphenyl dioxygenase [Zopfia rhizophila CBS 207.26]|uniref:Glyoxalase/Bleomycin resistance protein/Dihydroxybiphenyl dioxygenase n=1 Tax=Zopfia rhizophila CBS 207.26 TaxID=1314779 RepID=A0A6A6E0U3_9PEZI|nr:Glyoxalase/Bleomycin resistance protein/Dihydroxybiphenyl dioxygenase [Zopfia rhizophila CBS 207.26]